MQKLYIKCYRNIYVDRVLFILTVLFGTGCSGKILSKIGCRPWRIASVSVNSGRTKTLNDIRNIKIKV